MAQLNAERCRAEQARQLQLSLTEDLPNRRKIAETAAKAWGEAALEAEEREAEKSTPLSREDASIAREFAKDAAESKAEKEAKLDDVD